MFVFARKKWKRYIGTHYKNATTKCKFVFYIILVIVVEKNTELIVNIVLVAVYISTIPPQRFVANFKLFVRNWIQ